MPTTEPSNDKRPTPPAQLHDWQARVISTETSSLISPKMLGLVSACGLAGWAVWARAVIYSAAHDLGGHLPIEALDVIYLGQPRGGEVASLIEAGWLIEDEHGDFDLHEFEVWTKVVDTR